MRYYPEKLIGASMLVGAFLAAWAGSWRGAAELALVSGIWFGLALAHHDRKEKP